MLHNFFGVFSINRDNNIFEEVQEYNLNWPWKTLKYEHTNLAHGNSSLIHIIDNFRILKHSRNPTIFCLYFRFQEESEIILHNRTEHNLFL